MTNKTEKEFLSPDEVASKIGVTRRTIYKWIEETDFPKPFKIGHKLFLRWDEIEAYIESTRKVGE